MKLKAPYALTHTMWSPIDQKRLWHYIFAKARDLFVHAEKIAVLFLDLGLPLFADGL
jgi:hypothetical protein